METRWALQELFSGVVKTVTSREVLITGDLTQHKEALTLFWENFDKNFFLRILKSGVDF